MASDSPTVNDGPPEALSDDIRAERRVLRNLLNSAVPAKRPGENLLVATWNIRAFGGLTRKWDAGGRDSPKRDLRALRLIADIASRFDVIAVQEAKSDLTALIELMSALGGDWDFIFTDVTRSDAGNSERLAYIYDRARVSPSGLAAELVLPEEDRSWPGIAIGATGRQFVRTPYAVSFRAGEAQFILITLHVLFGDRASDRIPELTLIAEWLAEWAHWEHAFDDELIALGDFNITNMGSDLYAAFTSTGLQTPPDLDSLPRTVFKSDAKNRFYDQIAWFNGAGGAPRLESLKYLGGGTVDFSGTVFTELTPASMSWRISDHYPLFAEFEFAES